MNIIEKKYKYTQYLAGNIEHASVNEMEDWRTSISKMLYNSDLLTYNPVLQESIKVGKNPGDHIEYIKGLKRGGHWAKFKEEMSKIWWGNIKPGKQRYEIIQQFRYKAIIEGNEERDLEWWGDYESISRSTWIILNYVQKIPTWGTPAEAEQAFFLDIPIYAISNVPKTEMNSTLIWWILETGGEVFYTLQDCANFIIDKYKLNTIN